MKLAAASTIATAECLDLGTLRAAQVLQDLSGVNRHVDLAVHLCDVSVRAHDERLPLVVPRERHAEGDADLALRVADQEKGQLVVSGEGLVGVAVVRRDADEDGPGLGDVLPGVAEGARLLGASRRLVLRVEVDDDALALEGREVNGRPVLRGRGEVRRGFSDEIVGDGGRARRAQRKRPPTRRPPLPPESGQGRSSSKSRTPRRPRGAAERAFSRRASCRQRGSAQAHRTAPGLTGGRIP